MQSYRFWDERFSAPDYVYGKEPNDFLVSIAGQLPTGRLLSLCEGEGRNGCFLASLGFDVTGIDGSAVGLEKARRLAGEKGVPIRTVLTDLEEFSIAPASWEVITSIFAHLPRELRRRIHRKAVEGLVPGGMFVLEGYTPRQLNFDTGGPKNPELLFELEDLKQELAGLDFEIAQEIEREVVEGDKHTGRAAVVQILARKR